jgi:hypothetical protein
MAHGGLGIKDPTLMNLALGAKLLWQLITRTYDWWKKILHKKYFMGIRKLLRQLSQQGNDPQFGNC